MGYRRPDSGAAVSDRIRDIRRTLWVILLLNVLVALAKLVWGFVTRSASIQADGFHSMFDGTSNIIGLVGMGLASRPADRDHPYGHAKFETYASAVIGAMLVLAAYRVGSTAIQGLIRHGAGPQVDIWSFVIMVGTLAVNLFVTAWERREGKRLGSEVLIADSSHTMSDSIVSIGVIIGLVFVKLGFPMADPIVALLVAFAILWTAWEVFTQASATLSDSARLDPNDIRSAALSVEGVLGCHNVRSRGAQAEVHVDLHVQVDPSVSVSEGHQIAETVERYLASVFPNVSDVIVHLEPMDDYQQAKTSDETGPGLA